MRRWRSDRRRRAAGQAADLHEPERRGGRRAGALLQDRRRRTCWSSSTKCSCRSAVAGAGARVGRRAQRAEVGRSSSSATSFRGCGSASGAATRGAIWRTTCSRRFEPDETAEVERMIDAGGRCRRDVHHVGDRGGDERVQRRRMRTTDRNNALDILATHERGLGQVAGDRVRSRPSPEGDSNESDQTVRARLHRVARRDRRAGHRPAHAGRGHRRRA